MKNIFSTIIVLTFTLLFIGCSGTTQPQVGGIPKDAVYLEGKVDKALILAHGQGKHPTWKVVDPLRKGINEELGFHTLSLQMPNTRDNYKDYVQDFPEAYKTIKEAIAFFKNKGISDIYLMGHSMGARMVSAYLSDSMDDTIKGLIVVGCRNNGGYPLSCIENVENIDIPILDIWGNNNTKDNNAAAQRGYLSSYTYVQIKINGANHKLDGYNKELVNEVSKWLFSLR